LQHKGALDGDTVPVSGGNDCQVGGLRDVAAEGLAGEMATKVLCQGRALVTKNEYKNEGEERRGRVKATSNICLLVLIFGFWQGLREALKPRVCHWRYKEPKVRKKERSHCSPP
jgi:hypothetical protein